MPESIVLVTGGNNGIGLETCRQLANEPGVHVIMGSRSLDKGQAAIATLQAAPLQGTLSLVQLDINDDASIAAAVRTVSAQFDRIDTLVNNAGVCPLDFGRQVLRDTLETNATSPSMVTAAFLPLLRAATAPRVIYVTSTLGSIGLRADPKNPVRNEAYKAYRVSKAALNMLAVCEAWEYQSLGLRVFPYCPGYVVSDLAGQRQQKVDANVPTPEDSARGIVSIHRGEQDEHASEYLHRDGIVLGQPPRPW